MKKEHFYGLFVIVWLLLAGLACNIGPWGSEEPTPEPILGGDTLPFTVPLYSLTLEPGQTVPGSRLVYLGQTNGNYEVEINNQPAIKQPGDSFVWNGVIAPGVYGRYNLRLTAAILGRVHAAGPVEIFVLYPEPVRLAESRNTEDWLSFSNISIQYQVPQGSVIPGTTLVHEGAMDQGVRITGTGGHPFRAHGDSIIWYGQLRENVIVRYTLRVSSIEEFSLRLVGTADLWIQPRYYPPPS